MAATTSNRFEIKLHPYLKTALKYRADQRGLDLSAYIQELLWSHCPEANNQLEASLGVEATKRVREAKP
jgi:hypothetical protein